MNCRIFSIFFAPLIMASCISGRPFVEVLVPPSSRTPSHQEDMKEPPRDFYIVNGERYYPLPDSMGFVETGRASWYGEDFHGRPTSSGETYDMYKKQRPTRHSL
jgi:rare lipoprotein A